MSELQRIMLVEDDPDIAVLAGIALQDFGGFEFRHFSSGSEALANVADFAPDLVILDYRMPEMNGGEVLAALRASEAGRLIPVMFMTASLMPRHVEALIEAGAIAVLPKPFDPLTLADEVTKAWQRGKGTSAGIAG
ncbi:response regulator [Sphingomonas sinipercae]|uniref:Response regulator n=1 Tax=Sphingomonas sinipercae TaxID=2714944 RepID=A0A6G7ZKB0_9SPHN|nr:response regulator [Sphingomonas sinipercae]QIL01358.1 response regulator [Sphingomonas sinipercae]